MYNNLCTRALISFVASVLVSTTTGVTIVGATTVMMNAIVMRGTDTRTAMRPRGAIAAIAAGTATDVTVHRTLVSALGRHPAVQNMKIVAPGRLPPGGMMIGGL